MNKSLFVVGKFIKIRNCVNKTKTEGKIIEVDDKKIVVLAKNQIKLVFPYGYLQKNTKFWVF